MKTTKVLVPLDGSPLAEAAVWEAVELMDRASGTLVLVRAAEANTFPGRDPVEAQVRTVREAEDYLTGVAERMRQAGVARVDVHVWYGPAASAIVDAARVQQVDLIVMSSHGRSGLGRLVLGSVAEAVLRGTHVPILLLRPSQAPVATPGGGATRQEVAHV
jgi:nucleotide-binding universal stress UspA family protein